MKKTVILFPLLLLIFMCPFLNTSAFADTVVAGTWGQLDWEIDNNGVLTITGSGDMDDFHNVTEFEQAWPKYYETITAVNISENVTSIGSSAFSNCTNLEAIIIPENITSIGAGAFSNCTNLTSLTIPKNVTVIGKAAFGSCINLSNVNFNEGIQTIGDSAFARCENLTHIACPNSITRIEQNAFMYCSSLSSIEIPENISFGSEPFLSCDNLKDIYYGGSYIEWMAKPSLFLNDVIIHCAKDSLQGTFDNLQWTLYDTGLLDISGTGDMSDFTTNRTEAWTVYFNYIKTIVIESGITSIGKYAFTDSKSLNTISFPTSLVKIGMSAFNRCTNLNLVEYGGSKVEWKSITKENYNNPISVATIQYGKDSYTDSFGNMSWTLTNDGELILNGNGAMLSFATTNVNSAWRPYIDWITSVTINDGITTIGDNAFSNCYFPTITLPSSLISIGANAFQYCYNLENINIPSSVRNIGAFAFSECSNLKDVSLPENLVSIGAYAFEKSVSIENITIPSSVKTMGEWIFSECTGLTEVNILANDSYINKYMFSGCTKLKNINISEGINYIHERAFSSCKSLKNINIPSSVTYIGDYAFAECTLLEDATISSNTTYLGNSAFYMCESLNNIELPLGLEYIKDYTFAYCSNLTKIVIPSSIREIGFGAFMDCETLTDVNFKGTEEQWFSIRIRDYNTPLTLATITFVNQTIEPDFILPSSLQEIGEESFSGGTFVYVKLSENTKSIGRLAFADCPNLRYIYIPEATTSIDRYAFAFVNGLTILGKQNSYAETYANNYGYTFEPFE